MVYDYSCAPLITSLTPTYTMYTTIVITFDSQVLTVLMSVNVTKVTPSIVCTITVELVLITDRTADRVTDYRGVSKGQ